MLGKKLLNGLVGLVVGIARLLGLKLKVQLSEHKIKLSLVEPDKLENEAYDSTQYANGNIFLEGYANPIKARFDDAKENLELIASERYKHFMRMSLLKDLIRSTAGGGWTLKKILVVTLVISLVNTAMIGFFLVMLVGL